MGNDNSSANAYTSTSSFLRKPPVYISKPISAKSIKQRALKKRSVDRMKGNTNQNFRQEISY